eukprot:6189609-Pyramimonas_sp.AAC.1
MRCAFGSQDDSTDAGTREIIKEQVRHFALAILQTQSSLMYVLLLDLPLDGTTIALTVLLCVEECRRFWQP